MFASHPLRLSLVMLSLLVGLSLFQTSTACPTQNTFIKAYDNNHISALKNMANKLTSCSEKEGDKYRYLIARKLYDHAVKGKTEATITSRDYDDVIAVHPTLWAASADLGDISMKAKNYKKGLDFYEHALIDINGNSSDEIPEIKQDKNKITNDYILTLKDKADNARLLASLNHAFIPPVRTRAGKLNGMHTFTTRGVETSLHKYPILFDYKSHTLRKDKHNLQNLELLYETLQNAAEPDITITGHTDEIGGDAYNDQLSMRRANSIRDYLKKHKKYKGQIKAIGRGKRSEVRMHSAKRQNLTDDEWRQLNRRIETKRDFGG